MSNTIEVTLDCGCAVTLRQEWEHGCAGDCHPAVEVIAAGEITAPCPQHDDGLNERIAELEDECSNLEGEAEELREQRDSLESDIEEMEEDRDEALRRADDLERQVQELDGERCDFACPRCATGEVSSTAAQWESSGDTVSMEEAFREE